MVYQESVIPVWDGVGGMPVAVMYDLHFTISCYKNINNKCG